MRRAIISIAKGQRRYLENQTRLMDSLRRLGEEAFIAYWQECLPVGSPPHEETPYAFKAFALQEMMDQGYDTMLWTDCSVVPVRPLDALWELIETQGYWLSENLPHGTVSAESWNCSQWTCDSALPLLGSREWLSQVPHVITSAFGLCMNYGSARQFQAEFLRMAKDGRAFRGPWSNEHGEASSDSRVLGHRHDQTVASVLAYHLGMKLTRPPQWIVDGVQPTEETVIELCR